MIQLQSWVLKLLIVESQSDFTREVALEFTSHSFSGKDIRLDESKLKKGLFMFLWTVITRIS